MKQSYIKPSIKCQSIEEDASVLAASGLPVYPDEKDSVDPSEALSKENTSFSSQSLWDEDE